VLVATVRALKLQGGASDDALAAEDLRALEAGLANLLRHIENLGKFGLPVVVAVNRFASDTAAELALIDRLCSERNVRAVLSDHFARGGAGGENLARVVVETLDRGGADFRPLYPDDLALVRKIETIAREIYRARGVEFLPAVERRLAALEGAGYGRLPVCIAKTQYSFSADPTLLGAPSGHMLPIREVRLSAGAGFVVALAGELMTMPGLPRHPASERIGVAADGEIFGVH
jgi:formate--tetrahydrofolate ligase